MVVERINEVKDLSEQITISVFMDTQPPSGNPVGDHHDFQVNVEDGWVCVGGGATGKEMIVVSGVGSAYGALYPANYLTAHFLLSTPMVNMILKVGELCLEITYTLAR